MILTLFKIVAIAKSRFRLNRVFNGNLSRAANKVAEVKMSYTRRELPIKVTFSRSVQRPKKMKQHIKRVWVEGPEDDLPEEIELNADDVAMGGELMIEDLVLPEDCDVVDRRGVDAIVTVERERKEKRSGGDKRSRDDYDD
ncbi:MAG: hypothetical protein WBD20_24805 [Pirellulaceae bacterium]